MWKDLMANFMKEQITLIENTLPLIYEYESFLAGTLF